MDLEDNLSASSSSSSLEIVAAATYPSTINASTHKKSVGGEMLEKKRHPLYRGVWRRNRGKGVSEVREPNKKSKKWLGTFHNPEMAAVAQDVAAPAPHGDHAPLNFPHSAHRLPRAASSSHQDFQRSALQAARDFTPESTSPLSSSTSSTFSQNASKKGIVLKPLSICLDSENNVLDPSLSSNSFHAKDDERKIVETPSVGSERGSGTCGVVEFVDEEAIFNMPLLLDSMAEGMLLTPPAMKKGFNWSQGVDDDDIDLTLWGD